MQTAITGGERPERGPRFGSEEWIEAFEAQASDPDFVESVHRYARTRARLVAHGGRKVDDYYVNELVQDALDDTFDGVLVWDPARVDLKKHILDAIKSRTRHDYVQAQKHDSFEPGASRGTNAAVERALAAQQTYAAERAELESVSTRVLRELRKLAVRDPDVLLLIDAYGQDAIKKVDVMRATGLTRKRYDAARKRMRRLVLQLPQDLRAAAGARGPS